MLTNMGVLPLGEISFPTTAFGTAKITTEWVRGAPRARFEVDQNPTPSIT